MSDIRTSQVLVQVEYVQCFTYTGDITATLTPESTTYGDYAYTGDITATLTPESIACFNRIYTGDITLTLVPESECYFHLYTGNITATITPESIIDVSIKDYVVSLLGGVDCGGLCDFGFETPTTYELVPTGGIFCRGKNVFAFETPAAHEIILDGGMVCSGENDIDFEFPPTYEVSLDGGSIIGHRLDISFSYPGSFDTTTSGGIFVDGLCDISFIGKEDIPVYTLSGSGGVVLRGRAICEFTNPNDLPVFSLVNSGGVVFAGKNNTLFSIPPVYEVINTTELTCSGAGSFEFYIPSKVFELIGSGGLCISGTKLTSFSYPREFISSLSGGVIVDGCDVDNIYHTWVVTGKGFNTSIYSGFNFNSYTSFQGKSYGLKSDGLYLIDGTSDNGSDIHTGIKIGYKNFSKTGRKKLRSLSFSEDNESLNLKISDKTRSATSGINNNGKVYIPRSVYGKELNISVADFDIIDAMKIDVVSRGF